MEKINAVVFDFGGVLIDWSPWYLYQRVFSKKSEFEKFMVESRFHQWNERADCGENFADLFLEVAKYSPQWLSQVRMFPENFLETVGGAIDGTVQILNELKVANVPLYGLTNWSAETFPLAKAKYKFFSHFLNIVVSGEEKMIKPEQRFYQLALQRWKLNGGECLFIDDKLANIQAAEKVGMKAIHYQGPDPLRRDLQEYGFLAITK